MPYTLFHYNNYGLYKCNNYNMKSSSFPLGIPTFYAIYAVIIFSCVHF